MSAPLELTVETVELHRGQMQMQREAKRFNVPVMGRRFGKTQFCIDLITQPGGALDGARIGWFAPEYKYLADPYKDVVRMLSPVIANKNKTEGRIELITGGIIDFWTLDNPNAGRSRKYHLAIIDEAAMCRYLDEAWSQAIRPTLSDYQGSAWFPSTPKGGGFYEDLFARGNSDDPRFKDWQSWQMPTSVNPYIHPDEIESARLELGDLVFQQEYLAQFVNFGGTAVKREWLQIGEPPPRDQFIKLAMGVDLAISTKETADYTAIVVMGMTENGDRWVLDCGRARIPFNQVIEFIKQFAAKWDPQMIAIESIQYQAAVVQELARTTKLPVREVRPDRDKFVRFAPIQVRYEQGLIHHSKHLDPSFEREILTFPEEMDDGHFDLIDAEVMAFNAVTDIQTIMHRGSGKRETIRSAGDSNITVKRTRKGFGSVSSGTEYGS